MPLFDSPMTIQERGDSPSSSRTTDDDDSLINGKSDGFTPIMKCNPSSPVSPLTTPDDDDPASSSNDQIAMHFKSQQRRPGLGVTRGELDGPRDATGPPTVREARAALGYDERRTIECQLVAGDTVHMLSKPYYDEVCAWLDTNDDSTAAMFGQVDNTELFEYYEDETRPGRMRVNLREGEDFVFVSTKVWDLLMDWFGGGPCVTRKCFNDNGRVVVDIRGIEVKVKRSSRPAKFMRFVFSKYDTVGYMKRAVIEDWTKVFDNYTQGTYRIWDYANDKCIQRMHPESAQLATFRLVEGQSIMFEEADPITGEFKWDPETGEEPPNNYSSSSYATPSTLASSSPGGGGYNADANRRRRPENAITSSRIPIIPGAVGLTNLGNTCFMNSTLQCLSNIWLLRNRFVNEEYEADINASNPLGTGGKLARSFGDLMKLIWGNRGDVVSPSGFKSVMAEFKPEFSGYQQHDSQELLSFLLDGLHEDLNRVKVKPVTQAVDANGRPDQEVAADSCRIHRLRNDSFVNDLFEGFYKSTVICPDCQKVSVTFDPFTLVQLPVSRPKQAKTVTIPVAVLSSENGLPYKSSPTFVKIGQDASMHEVRAKACSNQKIADGGDVVSCDDFILCSVYRDRIEKIFSDFDKMDKVSSSDELVAFHDVNARRIKLINELHFSGLWHRPTLYYVRQQEQQQLSPGRKYQQPQEYDAMDLAKDFEDEDAVVVGMPSSAPEATSCCPFEQGDIWLGCLENRKYRARMQVTSVSAYGPWARCMGHQVKAVLDIAPVGGYLGAYSQMEKREGFEEVACEIVGYVRASSPSEGPNCVFELGQFLGMFGSFVADSPSITQETLPRGLVGRCTNREFFVGEIKEGERRYSSMYSQPKNFALLRWDPSAMDGLEYSQVKMTPPVALMGYGAAAGGPKRPPNPKTTLGLITVQHKKSYGVIGQPMVFSIPADATSNQLYDIFIQRMTRRIQSRMMISNEILQDNDPFRLKDLVRLTQRFPGENFVRVFEDDQDALVLANAQEHSVTNLLIVAEWDAMKLPDEDKPLYDALFGNLYTEDASDDDGRKMTKLYDCFDMFSEEEKLSSTETWYCSNCKAHKEAFKRMELWQLPPVLVVHLKRFSQSQSSYFVDKDDTEIDFPLEGLDLRGRVRNTVGNDDCVYDLVAVSHHYGGLGGGHYVAHARNEADGNWYEFDDSCVRLLGTTSAQAAHKVKGSSAYVLMYVKRTLTAGHWIGKNSRLQQQPQEFSATETMDPLYEDVGVV